MMFQRCTTLLACVGHLWNIWWMAGAIPLARLTNLFSVGPVVRISVEQNSASKLQWRILGPGALDIVGCFTGQRILCLD
jgi:hypothetical protein